MPCGYRGVPEEETVPERYAFPVTGLKHLSERF